MHGFTADYCYFTIWAPYAPACSEASLSSRESSEPQQEQIVDQHEKNQNSDSDAGLSRPWRSSSVEPCYAYILRDGCTTTIHIIYCVHGCTVYVGLIQARPNYNGTSLRLQTPMGLHKVSWLKQSVLISEIVLYIIIIQSNPHTNHLCTIISHHVKFRVFRW